MLAKLDNDMELRQGFPARARYRLQAAWRLGYREGPQATACCLRICASERYVGRAFLPHAPPMINDPPVHTLDVRHPHEFVAEPSLVLVLELDVAPELGPRFDPAEQAPAPARVDQSCSRVMRAGLPS